MRLILLVTVLSVLLSAKTQNDLNEYIVLCEDESGNQYEISYSSELRYDYIDEIDLCD